MDKMGFKMEKIGARLRGNFFKVGWEVIYVKDTCRFLQFLVVFYNWFTSVKFSNIF